MSVFDVWEEEYDFLSRLLESSYTPEDETRRLVDVSLLANSEDFHHLLECARSIQRSSSSSLNSLDGSDVLTFVWHILAGEKPSIPDAVIQPWAETDRLILLAKELSGKPPYIRNPLIRSTKGDGASVKSPRPRSRSVKRNAISHYWSTETNVQDNTPTCSISIGNNHTRQTSTRPGHLQAVTDLKQSISFGNQESTAASNLATSIRAQSQHINAQYKSEGGKTTTLCPTAHISPYFTEETIEKKFPQRRPPGVVSSVSFPPLTSSQFGLVQEKLAHEPFWLLIAVTFLIKTSGQAAIPVFYKVKERFPSPEELADSNNVEELLGMIRHLGLAVNRLGFIQKYAAAFTHNPPTPGKLYKVRHYDKRDTLPMAKGITGLGFDSDSSILTADATNTNTNAEAWEIGHMTQGKYTLDSWRIFCRDELLGRAQDWNGKGQRPEFQPEWMRVMPHDKELRAYLRWMWMREGWEWDPETGQRQVLRPELQAAVNEGRVEYDNAGGLQILETPRQNSAKKRDD